MPAVDPTFPLYPLACISAAIMLLLVLLTSFVRQSWNLGVAFLCFWLFWENLTGAINSILWSDNADIKAYVYCDIVSRIEFMSFIVKPMCTLIITRRLYLIASLRSEDAFGVRKRRTDTFIEWGLGLAIPLLLVGPLYYINQNQRFQVTEGTGCDAAISGESVLGILCSQVWAFFPALLSTTIYYPRMAWIFYTQHKDTSRFLRSNRSISHTSYFRLLFLASVDVLLTLPFGITTFVLSLLSQVRQLGTHIPFYEGWAVIHGDWKPTAITYAELREVGSVALAETYVAHWTSPILAFVIFCLFGATKGARATYWRLICSVGKWFGWKPTTRGVPALDTMAFGSRPQDHSRDIESAFEDRCAADNNSNGMEGESDVVINSANNPDVLESASENKKDDIEHTQPTLTHRLDDVKTS